MADSELGFETPARLHGHERYVAKWRNKALVGEYQSGNISISTLAEKYGISERQACLILGEKPSSISFCRKSFFAQIPARIKKTFPRLHDASEYLQGLVRRGGCVPKEKRHQ